MKRTKVPENFNKIQEIDTEVHNELERNGQNEYSTISFPGDINHKTQSLHKLSYYFKYGICTDWKLQLLMLKGSDFVVSTSETQRN